MSSTQRVKRGVVTSHPGISYGSDAVTDMSIWNVEVSRNRLNRWCVTRPGFGVDPGRGAGREAGPNAPLGQYWSHFRPYRYGFSRPSLRPVTLD